MCDAIEVKSRSAIGDRKFANLQGSNQRVISCFRGMDLAVNRTEFVHDGDFTSSLIMEGKDAAELLGCQGQI